MSAPPSTADVCQGEGYVRSVPVADINPFRRRQNRLRRFHVDYDPVLPLRLVLEFFTTEDALSPAAPADLGFPALPPPVDRSRSVLRRVDGCAHGRLLRSALTPWSGRHDAEHRSRTCPCGFDDYGRACLRTET